MAVFVFTLAVGLVYVWKKGALDWETLSGSSHG